MSLRSSLPLLFALLCGCANTPDYVNREAGISPDAGTSERMLVLEQTDPVLAMLPGETRDLAVRYVAPAGVDVSGQWVEFVLAGMTAGASVNPSRALTDAAGVVRTKLRVGSAMGMLQVRARSEGAEPVFVDVVIGQAVATKLHAGIDYRGMRSLSSFTITAVPGVACARALGGKVTGSVVYRIDDVSEAAKLELAPGSSAAVLAWGSDASGAPLARGCKDVMALVTSDPENTVELKVPLTDLEQRLEGELAVEVALDAAQPVKRLGEKIAAVVEAQLRPNAKYDMFAPANYYLDAMAEWLRVESATEALAALEKGRATATLAASLAPALANASKGPVPMAALLASQLAERGSTLVFSGKLESTTKFSILGVGAQGGGDGVAMLTLESMPSAALSARFQPELAKVIVDAMVIDFGLGRYGRALLFALRSESGGALQRALETTAGCAELQAWSATQLNGICDASCALASCRVAIDKTLAAIERGFTELDASGSTITLGGTAPTHDRTDDGKVDDLGPGELNGTWGQGAQIEADLREPARNALTL